MLPTLWWRPMASSITAVVLVLSLTASHAAVAADTSAPDSNGSVVATSGESLFPLAYDPPKPGSYHLPLIQPAGHGQVIDADGSKRHLSDYFGDKIVLLSFVFTRCSNPKGCPYATLALHELAARIDNDPRLDGNVRLLSLSFDPGFDDPGMMRKYAFASGRSDYLDTPWKSRTWDFLTTRSRKQLQPILNSFGQHVTPIRTKAGNIISFSHVLKVYLIDQQSRIRNIYSASFLKPQLVVNDIKTLAMGSSAETGDT